MTIQAESSNLEEISEIIQVGDSGLITFVEGRNPRCFGLFLQHIGTYKGESAILFERIQTTRKRRQQKLGERNPSRKLQQEGGRELVQCKKIIKINLLFCKTVKY